MARAREGKDGRPPRFDPVLEEVTAKLEQEVFGSVPLHESCCLPLFKGSHQVARIKMGEAATAESGGCLKATTASQEQAAGKAPVDLGPKPPYAVENKKVRSRIGLKGGI